MTGTEDPQVSYEKHKIFLYKEDFEQFSEGLEDVIGFIKRELGTPIISRSEYNERMAAANAEEASEETNAAADEEKPQKKGFFNKLF